MYLHENREDFKDIIEQVANATGRTPVVIEKDYYVTIILRLLSKKLEHCVFKGGTSLSKGFHAIDRFSEDIDITFDEHIGAARRKKLKNVVLKEISEELGLPITNWENTQSDRDYNAYHFAYNSVFGIEDDRLPQYVKLETALASYAFPTEVVKIDNYIGAYLEGKGYVEIVEKYHLGQFSMKLQSLERTFVDKIFALCDYYLQGKSKRYSRHLYDLYKLTPRMKFDNEFLELVKEIRRHRATLDICPSAKEDINIVKLVEEFCGSEFFKEDYQAITSYFVADYVSYEDTIENLKKIVKKLFDII